MSRAGPVRATNLICAALACLLSLPGSVRSEETSLDKAKAAFEKGEYTQAIEILKNAASGETNNGDLFVLLARSYLELNQYDAAVNSAEKAVLLSPKNSEYHRWLGEAYGAKADHASMLSAYSLARKTQKEFAAAVDLDAHNFDAQQDLIEYDCTAPGMVGGGEEKTLARITKGEFFGDMAMFTQSPRSADVVAEGETRLLRFGAESFRLLIGQNPAAAAPMLFGIAGSMAHRIMEDNHRFQREVAAEFVWR